MNSLILFSSLVATVVLIFVLIYFYLRSVYLSLVDKWILINRRLRVRLDKIPILIEYLDKYDQIDRHIFDELITLREETWPLDKGNKKNIKNELEITAQLRKIWNLENSVVELKKDIKYLSIKNNIISLGKEIDEMSSLYNENVRKFNKLIKKLFFFSKIFKFKKQFLFEFEP